MNVREKSEGGVRILHVGNVFLDKPVPRLRREGSENRREELRDSFSALMQAVEERNIQLVLFSGNLVDNAFVTNDTVVFLARQFSNHPTCQFVIAPGTKDAYVDGSIYRSPRFGKNVHIFTEETLSRMDFDELGVSVYGWAIKDEENLVSPLADKCVFDPYRLNLVCGYGNIDGEEREPFVASKDIAAFGAHYAALSGSGRHDGFLRLDGTVASLTGGFECTSFSHKEPGGVNYVYALPLDDGAWRLTTKRVITGIYRYAEESIDVSHLLNETGAAPLVCERIREREYGEKTALRVYLRGTVAPEASFIALPTAADYGVYAIEFVDQTVPTDGMDWLLHDMSAGGELYRHLYRAMTEGTPESRARAARTFRIGYAALEGKDFTRH